jgi:hypothetical protein
MVKPGTQLQQNINRIDHIAYLYRDTERMLDAKMALSAVLGLEPEDWEEPFDDVHPSYSHIELCWRAGFELICPRPGHEGDWIFHDLIEERGEGIATVVIGVPDLDEAIERAEKAGYPVRHIIEDSRHENARDVNHEMGEPLKAPFKIIREAMITPFNSVIMAFGEIVPNDSY